MNDRDTADGDRNTTRVGTIEASAVLDGALRAALGRLRLDGALFFRAEFTEGWAYEAPQAVDAIANSLRPGAERLIIFHIVASGSCWISLPDGERMWAGKGDVVVVPYGDVHRMGGHAQAAVVPFLELIEPPPWTTLPVLRHGEGGPRTDVVCGYLYSRDPLFDPGMRALPPVFVQRPREGPAARWLESSIEYALALSSEAPPDDPASTRLPELLLVEILREHLSTAPAAEHGFIGALRDPTLAPALARLHAAPERKWTVAELASEVSVSRSLLDDRFRQVLGRSPIRYLTEWRMHVAEELLQSTNLGVAQVARRVGYDSEEAFSRAFKRVHGTSPSHWRTAVPR